MLDIIIFAALDAKSGDLIYFAAMKVWIQRASEASVTIGGETVASTGRGYLILLGVTHGDDGKIAAHLAEKTCAIRLFEDDQGKMNRSIEEIGGEILVVSQFTLYADASRGRRPGFSNAAPGGVAEPLYEEFVAALRERLGEKRVQTGRFGADMKVALVNDGPVSIELREERPDARP